MVKEPQNPAELALFSELPGAPFSTPLNWFPAPPKLAKLKTLKKDAFGSNFTRSPTRNGQLNRKSIVFSQVASAECPGGP